MAPKKEKAFSISKAQMVYLIEELEHGMDFSKWVLERYLKEHPEQEFVIALLCECFAVSTKMKTEIEKMLECNPIITPEDGAEEELLLEKQDVTLLETGSLTRYFVTQELASISGISLQMH